MNNKGMSLFSLILLFFTLTLGGLYLAADEGGIPRENVTEIFEVTMRNATNITLDIDLPQSPELGNAIEYYAEGMIRAYGEIGIWIAKFVEANPQAPYKLVLYLLLLSICAPIIIVLFKLLVIIFLLVKEYVQSRRDKKKLNKVSKNV